MKALLALAVASSLALNLTLVVLLFAGRTSPTAPTTSTELVASESPRPEATPIDGQTWTTLKPDDLRSMVQELRDSGFPPNIVRAIIAGRLREIYGARARALDPQSETRPFWQNASTDAKLMMAQRQLYREEQKTLRDLLGNDADTDINSLFQRRRFDSVPPAKLDDVRQVLREFEDRRSDAYSGGGMIGSEQARRLAAIDREEREALAGVLTPPELEAYMLRNSNTAQSLRYQLSAFNPSEDEFRAIYRLQADFDSQFGRMYGPPSQEEMQRRNEAQRQLTEQMKATLGPVRGADYELANDHQFRQTSQLIGRLDLPPETTNQIWSVKKAIEEQANAIRRDQSLPPAERTQRLAALSDEAASKITPLVGGSRGFEAYRQYGGSWMQSLVARPGSPPGTGGSGVIQLR